MFWLVITIMLIMALVVVLGVISGVEETSLEEQERCLREEAERQKVRQLERELRRKNNGKGK